MAKSPDTLHADIERRLPDNDERLITPLAVRNTLHDLVDADQRGPNYRPSGQLSVIYLTKAEADRTGRPYATLDQLDSTWFYNGMECRVDLHPEGFGVVMQLVYDNRADVGAGLLAFIDGSLQLYTQAVRNGKNPVKWVRKDSAEALTANVALYKAGTNYRGNDLVRALFGTFPSVESVVFYSNESGTDIPAPSRPEGDAYWTVFNPAPSTYQAWQSLSPAELRELQAANKLSPGRLYIVTPRLIPDDPSDNSYPDLFIRALLESVLEPTGYLLMPTGERPLVNYDLATDTTEPVATGGASSFAELAGYPSDNAELAVVLEGKLSVYLASPTVSLTNKLITRAEAVAAANEPQQRPFCVVQPDGTTAYFRFWTDLGGVPAGSQVRLRGAFGLSNQDYYFPQEITLVLEAGSVFTCRTLYAHTGPAGADGWKVRRIEGTGTLRGKLMWYGDSQVRLSLRDFRHEGTLEHNAYGGPAAGWLSGDISVSGVRGMAPAGQAYFTGYYRNGGFFTAWYQASFYNCRISVMGAAAIVLFTNNTDATTDAAARTNNLLRLEGNHFGGDGANKVLNTDASGQACRFEIGTNYAADITPPTGISNHTAYNIFGGTSGSTPPPAPTYPAGAAVAPLYVSEDSTVADENGLLRRQQTGNWQKSSPNTSYKDGTARYVGPGGAGTAIYTGYARSFRLYGGGKASTAVVVTVAIADNPPITLAIGADTGSYTSQDFGSVKKLTVKIAVDSTNNSYVEDDGIDWFDTAPPA